MSATTGDADDAIVRGTPRGKEGDRMGNRRKKEKGGQARGGWGGGTATQPAPRAEKAR